MTLKSLIKNVLFCILFSAIGVYSGERIIHNFSTDSLSTFHIDPGLANTIQLEETGAFSYLTLMKQDLNDGTKPTGGVGNKQACSPLVEKIDENEFKVAYISWDALHSDVDDLPRSDWIYIRDVLFSGLDAADFSPQTIQAVQAIQQLLPSGTFYGLGPADDVPQRPPTHLDFSANDTAYAVSWGTGFLQGPIGLTSNYMTNLGVTQRYGILGDQDSAVYDVPELSGEPAMVVVPGTGFKTAAMVYHISQAPAPGNEHRSVIRWVQLDSYDGFTFASAVDTFLAVNGSTVQQRSFAIDADESGTILIGWREGTDIFVKAYDKNHVEIMPAQLLNTGRALETHLSSGENNMQYRDFDIKAISDGNFVLTWGSGGHIYFKRIEPGNVTPIQGEREIEPTCTDCHWPSVTSSNRFILFTFYGDVTGGSMRPIAYRYRFDGNDVSANVADLHVEEIDNQDVTFNSSLIASHPSWKKSHSYSIISSGIDDKGNFVSAWNHELGAKIRAFANAVVYQDSGSFVSQALTMTNSAVVEPYDPSQDSIQLLQFITGEGSDVQVQFRQSENLTFGNPADTFYSIPLGGNITTPKRHSGNWYSYNISMESTQSGRVTPAIDSIIIRWNVKPRTPVIDSIKIGNTGSWKPFSVDSTYVVISRFDSVLIAFHAFDYDAPTNLMGLLQNTISDIASLDSMTNTSPGHFSGVIRVPPQDTVIASYLLELRVRDEHTWDSRAAEVHLNYMNFAPEHQARVQFPLGNGQGDLDSLANNGDVFRMNVGDTARVQFTFRDDNDSILQLWWNSHAGADTSVSGVSFMKVWDTLNFSILPDAIDTLPDTILESSKIDLLVDTVRVIYSDDDVDSSIYLYFVPNHAPKLDSLFSSGYINDLGEYVEAPLEMNADPRNFRNLQIHNPGVPIAIVKNQTDPDVINADHPSVEWHVLELDENGQPCCDSLLGTYDTLVYSFPEEPRLLRMVSIDLAGAYSEDTVFVQYPSSDFDSLWQSTLSRPDSVDLVIGSGKTADTIEFSLKSSGTMPLQVSSVQSKNQSSIWLSYQMEWEDTTGSPHRVFVESFTDSSRVDSLAPIFLGNGSALNFKVFYDVSNLRGDGIYNDTLLIYTNDFFNPVISVPLLLIFNDLPQVSFYYRSPDFNSGVLNPAQGGMLPIRSEFVFAFSEPVNGVGIDSFVQVYSLPDSIARGVNGITPMDGKYSDQYLKIVAKKQSLSLAKKSAKAGYIDTLIFVPWYKTASDSFGDLPPPSSFLQSDIIHVHMSNSIEDTTGNALDLSGNRIRFALGTQDTIFEFYTDTSTLKVISSYPDSGGVLDPDLPIRLHFNNPLTTWSVFEDDSILSLDFDSTRAGTNRTISIRSAYNRWNEVDQQPMTLESDDSVLVIRPLRKFWSGDTVLLRVKPNLSDVWGHTLDGNKNGTGFYLLHRGDTTDYFELRFVVQPTAFYVYPNPYHFDDPRHREKGSISFKNLNNLPGVRPGEKIEIRIYTVTGDLVRSTERKGESPVFSMGATANPPEWQWDMHNNAGFLVASGVYMYTIKTGRKGVIRRGKVAVIR